MSSADTLEKLAFLSAADPDYLADLYSRYLDNPTKIDESWASFFDGLDDNSRALLDDLKGASWTPSENKIQAVLSQAANSGMKDPVVKKPVTDGKSEKEVRQSTVDSIRALMLIRAYRIRGHLKADLDPLGISKQRSHPELEPETYGFSGEDWDRPIFINGMLGLETAPLREIMTALHDTYCGTIGLEYMHVQDPEQKSWLQERIEAGHNQTDFSVEGKKAILSRLTASEGFEKFLQTKYTGTKRFGLEGGESLVPAIEQIMKRGGQLGLKEMVIGMAHRGRLNVLTNIMGKPFAAIFHEFRGGSFKPQDVQGSGDVKYHLGTSSDRDFDGNIVHLSLTPNPSHLEIVNPVVLGKTYAKQVQREDKHKSEAMALILHGDAAIAGQGIMQECMLLTKLDGYGTGGSIHYVINNQIGFTTNPEESRSGTYCTDIGKMSDSPIFHVNGDDPEAVVHVARIAIEFRQQFKKDVFIDMICYRRHGHNEGDEPAFTQPLMYDSIKHQKTTRNLYAEELMREGVLTAEDNEKMEQEWNDLLEEEFQTAESYRPNDADMLKGHWSGISLPSDDERRGDTAISKDKAQKIGKALCTVPDDFTINSKIERQLKAKQKMFESGEGFDWATAEALAFGALCEEGFPVRLSGQDSERGTFSQRHSVWIDQKNRQKYIPLNHIDDKQASYLVYNSPLSEVGVLGFEYGFSSAEPNILTLWEAQFGDFVNGAQVVIDQFITSAETKWLRMSGLVMLLPHGFEGQGPEHSSARMERFLQQCAEDNIQIVNCTTPASYFHVLRRQMHREFRKPLIIFTPKSLLRHKRAVSPLSMMTGDETFHRILYEDKLPAKPEEIRRVVLCSGKVFYDLEEFRDSEGVKDVTIMRLEQIYPFPHACLKQELAAFPNAEVVWCQEEPENMGAWSFVDRRIEKVLQELELKNNRPRYIGRPAAASPAAGLMSQHQYEQARLVEDAITL
jgi:2-oxoglutarate dehydrogenase E1 component